MVWSKSRTHGTCQGELGMVLQRELAPDFKWNWLQVPPKSWCVFRILPKDLGASGEWGSELWTDHERHLQHWNSENGWMVCQGCSLNGRVQHVIDSKTATPTRQCTPAWIFSCCTEDVDIAIVVRWCRHHHHHHHHHHQLGESQVHFQTSMFHKLRLSRHFLVNFCGIPVAPVIFLNLWSVTKVPEFPWGGASDAD